MQATVLEMACLTGDRTKSEQKAMLSEGKRIDAERNAIKGTNPRAKQVLHCPGWWNLYEPPQGLPVWDLDSREAQAAKSIDNPQRHPKGCVCRRTNLIPAVGLSMLGEYVAATWEPYDD